MVFKKGACFGESAHDKYFLGVYVGATYRWKTPMCARLWLYFELGLPFYSQRKLKTGACKMFGHSLLRTLPLSQSPSLGGTVFIDRGRDLKLLRNLNAAWPTYSPQTPTHLWLPRKAFLGFLMTCEFPFPFHSFIPGQPMVSNPP